MNEREAALEKELSASRLENKLLREKVDALIRLLYGRKSEKLDPGQLMLLEVLESKKAEAPAAAEADAGAGPRTTRRKKPEGPRIPEHLPVKEEVIDPEEVKADPLAWRYIGEEVSERLDYEPARFSKLRLIRRRFVPKDNPYHPPVIAPLPPTLQERCLATPGLIAQVVASKYADHQPLYRQEQIYSRRDGVDIPRQTLCRWTALAADTLEPLYKLMVEQQQGHPYLQIDETPIRYLSPGLGKAPQGYFWVTSIPAGDAIYHWHAGRGADRLHQIITTNFEGTLQCDGYRAYTSFQKQRAGPIELAACWAHARRKFIEAEERDPLVCRWMLRQIAQLYRIEARLREQNAGPALRLAVRSSESAAILRRIKKALFKLKPRYLPKSNMGKAVAYAMEQWDGLELYRLNGSIEIDNNLVENAIRPTKLGMKNWLFLGSEASGRTSAILFTIIESAKRHGLEPYAYIRHLLEALPITTNWNLHKLAPAAYAKSQNKAAA
jgi:transposase